MYAINFTALNVFKSQAGYLFLRKYMCWVYVGYMFVVEVRFAFWLLCSFPSKKKKRFQGKFTDCAVYFVTSRRKL